MSEYGKIISKSITIVKHNRWLLVYGLLIGASGGLGGGNGGSSIDSDDIKNLQKTFDGKENLPDKGKEVLGAFTTQIEDWITNVPLSTWLWLLIALLTALLLGIVISYILKNWVRGSLIAGVEKALKNESVDLTNTSPAGISHIKLLISQSVLLALLAIGLTLGLSLVGGIVWAIIYFILRSVTVLKTIWMVIGIISLISGFIYLSLIFAMINMYSERLIVLKGYTPKEAIRKGYSLSKSGFGTTLLMGIINNLIGTGVGCATVIVMGIFLLVPGLIFLYPSIKNGHWPAPGTIVMLLLIFLLLMLIGRIISAAVNVFKYANWQQIFEEVYAKVENDDSGNSRPQLKTDSNSEPEGKGGNNG